MNRLLAAAAAGALALAALPMTNANAQDLPKETKDARGETYFLNEEGTHYVPDAQEALKPFAQLDSAQQEKAVAIVDAAVAGLIDTGVIRDAQTSVQAPAPAPAPELSEEEKAEAQSGGEATQAAAEKPLGADNVDPANPDPVANGLVKFPPVATLDGVTYFLNKNGHTFVADVLRVNSDVTPEEIALSDGLVAKFAGEIARQGIEAARAAGDLNVDVAPAAPYAAERGGAETVDAAAADTAATAQRGLAAETGSNTLVRALFALLLASVLGAGVYAFARRRLI
ncbi:hypothetical protein HMPREF2736_10655 [Corynebacterium sp. HMSC036E10]|uniref:hypothetical protein n=1 Tax=Corynebacterium sp. HMSC036E10 TaxID=1715215 RepID=UPI0008A83376|nr:hypothetical protein [Corynebacterium sp. HMSC036E10]OHO78353.1 hypothetical protein HMPREF2736_10655 [Corynebacterium sp. HMSC036E10]